MRTRVLSIFLLLVSFSAFAQELNVGVKVSEPFVTAEHTGISIDVWENTFTGTSNYTSYPTVDALLKAVAEGEVDVAVGAITVTPERERLIDFMFPYHQTGLTYATIGDESLFAIFVDVIPTILYAVFIIFSVMAVCGALFAFVEHRNLSFKERCKKIFSGIYWATATFTTVGYGDEAAKTTFGRFFSTILMWLGLVVTGSLTALIVSAVSVQSATLNDFNILKADIAVVDGSAGLHYVERLVKSHNIHIFETLDAAAQSVVSGRTDAVVHDEALLNYMSNKYPELYVSPETFNEDYYAFAVPEGWEQLEEFNISMLENNEF